MAVANEIVWRWTAATMSDGAAFRAWTLYKFPGCVVITLLFAFANVPMLMKHGLNVGGRCVTARYRRNERNPPPGEGRDASAPMGEG